MRIYINRTLSTQEIIVDFVSTDEEGNTQWDKVVEAVIITGEGKDICHKVMDQGPKELTKLNALLTEVFKLGLEIAKS